jgi:hypothetical protein
MALAAPACAPANVVAVPPVVDVPAAPAPRARRGTQGAPARAGDPPAPWNEHVVWTAKTRARAMATCQLAAYTFASTVTLENRLVAPAGDGARLAMRVVRDDENATGVAPLPVLLGKGYVADAAGGGPALRESEGETVSVAEAARVRPLAATFVGWPGADVAAHPPAQGTEVGALEGPVAAIAQVPLYGGQIPTRGKATVTSTGRESAGAGGGANAGDVLTFGVVVRASEDDAGMCHHWTHDATLQGTMRLRASNGALLEMHLEGDTGDTEALCQDPHGRPGPPPPPRTCDTGTMTFELSQQRVP